MLGVVKELPDLQPKLLAAGQQFRVADPEDRPQAPFSRLGRGIDSTK
jgi:hypothetical protein